MERNEVLNNLTDGERAYAEKVDALLNDEKNRDRLASIRTIGEAIDFFEENGIRFTDAQKEDIRKKAGELEAASASRELTPDDLEAAAGGWSWKYAAAGGGVGALMGALGGAVVGIGIASGPVGWCALAGAAVTAAACGGLLGAVKDD